MVNKKKSCGRLSDNEDSLLLFSLDDCPECVPAAGWRNGDSLNNAEENGNYWSSSPDSSDSKNAFNLNFNTSGQNVNNNNRNNGHTVRPVSELTNQSREEGQVRHFSISEQQLLLDLFRAYKDARKHKRGRAYQLEYEFNLEDNLVNLRDELLGGTYRPGSSSCFIIHEPKMREVFAAAFRDRIVHHLFYNYTHILFENTFIYDCYSCIVGRGTHFGINRLKHHIRSVSAGYSKPCYVLKIDICGYFMNINRNVLYDLCIESLEKQKTHAASDGRTWGEVLDYEFVEYLLSVIIHNDAITNCNVIGYPSEWDALPPGKSLFCSPANCGLPIGNLSSQLFSNVYMNVFDQYMKRNLGCRHYGRYVDDAYVVSSDREFLKGIIPSLSAFLQSSLGLQIHPHKTRIYDAYQGIEYLGAYIKPFRTYISHSSLKRIRRRLCSPAPFRPELLRASVNSYLGVLSHYDSFCLRRVLFGNNALLQESGKFSPKWLIYHPNQNRRTRNFV